MSYKVAVTGGIGSGKTTVCEILKNLGYPVISCDEVYSELLKDGEFALKVCGVVGVPPVLINGKPGLNFKAVSEKVFSDSLLRKKLEEFTHPVIMEKVFSEADRIGGLVFAEVPLLLESGLNVRFDDIIVVLREEGKRVESVARRSGISEEEVRARIRAQIDYNNISNIPAGSHILVNDGDIPLLEMKVRELADGIRKEIG